MTIPPVTLHAHTLSRPSAGQAKATARQLANHLVAVMAVLVLAALLSPVYARDYQSHDSISRAVNTFMQAYLKHNGMPDATIEPGHLDPRLRLKQCERALSVFLPRGSRVLGRITVGVKCAGTKAWSIHVPLTVKVTKTIAVASKLLPRGTLLSKTDIRMKTVDLATLPHGYIDNMAALLGQRLKRRLSPGVAFSPAIVRKPEKIKRGQRVTIIARSGAMAVRMAGKALSSGAVGERIKVINTASKRKREGVITAQGEIQVDL